MPARLRCAACHEAMPGPGLATHLAAHPEHQREAFELFIRDHPDRRLEDGIDGEASMDGLPCDSARRIVPTWDDHERQRFAGATGPCHAAPVRCACGDTMCGTHAIPCDTCGRFACLRHRHSGHCPDCAPGRRRQHVAVPKHDPFSKETKLVSRTYMRPGPDVWGPAQPSDAQRT